MKKLFFLTLLIAMSGTALYGCGNECSYKTDKEDKVRQAREEAWHKSLKSCEKVCVRVDCPGHWATCGFFSTFVVTLKNKEKSTIKDVKEALMQQAPSDTYVTSDHPAIWKAEMGITKPAVVKELTEFGGSYWLYLEPGKAIKPEITLEELIKAGKYKPGTLLYCQLMSNL